MAESKIGTSPVGTFRWENPTVTGYKLKENQPNSMEVTAEGPNVTNVYYVVDEEQTFAYTVNFYEDGTTDKVAESFEGYHALGTFSWENPIIEGYVLKENQPSSMEITAEGTNVVNVYYELDENKDEIADKYQVTVMFGAINGHFENGSTQESKVVTLRDVNGNLSEDGSYEMGLDEFPGATASEGYDQDSQKWVWQDGGKEVNENVVITSTNSPVFLVSFERGEYDVKISYYYDERFKWNQEYKEEFGTVVEIEPADKDTQDGVNYILERVENNGLTVGTGTNDINIYYVSDANEDGIADKYQVTVVFAAVNGQFDNGSTQAERTFTLKEDGENSENGYYIITEEDIPTATANEGYGNGTWAPADPKGIWITKEEGPFVFTITFTQLPDNPDPTDPGDGGDGDDETTGGGGTTTTPTTPAPTGVLGERVEVPADAGVLGERVPETEDAGVLGERRGAGTGDETPIFGWVALAGCAAAALAFVGFRKRKEK